MAEAEKVWLPLDVAADRIGVTKSALYARKYPRRHLEGGTNRVEAEVPLIDLEAGRRRKKPDLTKRLLREANLGDRIVELPTANSLLGSVAEARGALDRLSVRLDHLENSVERRVGALELALQSAERESQRRTIEHLADLVTRTLDDRQRDLLIALIEKLPHHDYGAP